MRIPFISLVAAGSLALGGCAYGDMGYGLGVGYGSPYYGYGYDSPYYGYGYGSPYYGASLGYGWYDNYYYPGTGYYVYDQYRRPHMWSDSQRSYWTQHRRTNTTQAANWSRFTSHVLTARSGRTTVRSSDDSSVSSTSTTTQRQRRRRH